VVVNRRYQRMSFFFDVLTSQGFVLASDVRFVINGEPKHAHKLDISSGASKVNCAIAVCGEYPMLSLNRDSAQMCCFTNLESWLMSVAQPALIGYVSSQGTLP
jgi:hypothetical protein